MPKNEMSMRKKKMKKKKNEITCKIYLSIYNV